MKVFKQIRIEKELLERAKKAAVESGLSLSAWIRLLIVAKLKE